MMWVRSLTFIFAVLAPFQAFAGTQFGLDAGLLHSRLEYNGAAEFTLLSKAGTFARIDLGLGSRSWDFLIRTQMNMFDFDAPNTRTINGSKVSTNSYEGSVRWKAKACWLSLGYENKEIIYLADQSTTVYDLKTAPVSFGTLGFKLFGKGAGYRLALDSAVSLPIGSASVDEGKFNINYLFRGQVRIEFGTTTRFGFLVGMENQNYRVGTSQYFRSDLTAGLSFTLGADK
jgi:hypothetical protein